MFRSLVMLPVLVLINCAMSNRVQESEAICDDDTLEMPSYLQVGNLPHVFEVQVEQCLEDNFCDEYDCYTEDIQDLQICCPSYEANDLRRYDFYYRERCGAWKMTDSAETLAAFNLMGPDRVLFLNGEIYSGELYCNFRFIDGRE